ncbi:MAG TPA: TatD family deoxyribonuclease [Gammaproteobacteria bacterium]|nr:TatD family deoxyribonuclease [Gammaproteobacteria bacterium]
MPQEPVSLPPGVHLVDSHCHLDRLDLAGLGQDLAGVLARARELGVARMLCVSINRAELPAVLALAEAHESVWASAGVHPNEQEKTEICEEELLALADHPRVIAVGETGLDYFRSVGDLEWQRERFRRHIAVARRLGKPLIIHSRDAAQDTLRIMKESGAGEAGGVMHCFAGDWAMAKAALDLGFYISFSGIVTFRNAAELREVARQVPEERLLVETDAPYLTPVPYRGKPNQPGYTRFVAECLAELRGVDVVRIARITTANFDRLFGTGDSG